MIQRLATLVFALLVLALPAQAASFDCSKAATPFEHAICDHAELSGADDILAKTFATAMGGLTAPAADAMRADQRDWLSFAQRACTDDAEPLQAGRYDEQGANCLVDLFKARSRALEGSRMIGGHRFYVTSSYDALPDPYEVDNPDSYWKVAKHEAVLPLIDTDDPLAEGFNAFVREQGSRLSDLLAPAGGEELAGPDPSADTSVDVVVEEVVGTRRITLAVSTYWYGHGAAHGNYSLTYLHYHSPEQRAVVASDIFAGKSWQKVLANAAWAQLQAEHGEWLQVESAADIADAVVDPARWDLSDDYGLVIQFQPYEVSAYAYGAPTITIPWDSLGAIKAEGQDLVRYGW